MMRTIAVVNQKGGCGKTTVAINLASALAGDGKKVLLVDMDPQSHCAVGLAVPEEQIEQSIYDVLISKSRNEPIRLSEILWQINDRLELAPASIDLSAFEQQMAGIAERECCLKNVLEQAQSEYDYTVVDCPPAVGLLTFNALLAATDVIVPVETGYFALHGLSKQLETLSILCERCSQHVNVKVLTSMYDIRTKMAREILAELRSHFADRMFKTVVNFNTKIKEAASFGQPINEYDPASKGQRDFAALAREIMGLEAKQQRQQMVNTLADQLESISESASELAESAEPVSAEEPEQEALGSSPLRGKQTDQEDQAGEPAAALPDTAATSLGDKLSDYYGVNQISDALVFVTLYPRAQSVQVAGDFNNWQPADNPLQRVGDSGVWQTQIKLPHGKYRYRLVVDGQWQQDPYNEHTELNPYGEYNSLVEVK
jgi:chromosome partitioning protein